MAASLTIYPRGGQRRHHRHRSQQRRPSRHPNLSDFMPKEVQQSHAKGRGRRERRAPRAVFKRPVTKTRNAFSALREEEIPRVKPAAKSRRIRRPAPAQPAALQGAWRADAAAAEPPHYTAAEACAATTALKTMLGIGKSSHTPFAAEAAAARAIAREAAAAAAQPRSEEQLLADNRAMAKRLRAAEDLLKCLQGDAAPKKVRFANDDPETLMKPVPTSTRVYFKDAPPRELAAPAADDAASCDAASAAADAAFLAKRGTGNAWRPKSATKVSAARRPKAASWAANIKHGSPWAIAPRLEAAAAEPKSNASWADRCEDEDDMFADGW